MEQEYDNWNIIKKNLSNKDKNFIFKEGDIWWISLGLNLGTESYGKGELFRRPVLIIKKLNNTSCIVLPLTSKIKEGSWFTNITFKGENKTVLLYQIRMINIKRFQRRLGVLDDNDFRKVKEKLKILLELI